jgi:hypothetical protein
MKRLLIARQSKQDPTQASLLPNDT